MSEQGPLQKLFGPVLLLGALAAIVATLYYAIVEPHSFTSGGSAKFFGRELTPREGAVIFIVIFAGGFTLIGFWLRRHRRRMRELGLDPDADAERYFRAYLGGASTGGDPRKLSRARILGDMVGIPAARPVRPEDLGGEPEPDPSDRPLANYLGQWRVPHEQPSPPGWIARAVIRAEGEKVFVRIWSASATGLVDDGEVAATLQGDPTQVLFIEARTVVARRERRIRFTSSSAGGDRMDAAEVQYPVGNARDMSAKSLVLQRQK